MSDAADRARRAGAALVACHELVTQIARTQAPSVKRRRELLEQLRTAITYACELHLDAGAGVQKSVALPQGSSVLVAHALELAEATRELDAIPLTASGHMAERRARALERCTELERQVLGRAVALRRDK